MSQKKTRSLLVRSEDAPVLSDDTHREIKALAMFCQPGSVNQVGVFHDQFCADALENGAAKCACKPDVRLIKGRKDGRAVELPTNRN